MRMHIFAASFVLAAFPAYAADPIGFIDLGDARASTATTDPASGGQRPSGGGAPLAPALAGAQTVAQCTAQGSTMEDCLCASVLRSGSIAALTEFRLRHPNADTLCHATAQTTDPDAGEGGGIAVGEGNRGNGDAGAGGNNGGNNNGGGGNDDNDDDDTGNGGGKGKGGKGKHDGKGKGKGKGKGGNGRS